MLCYVIGFTHMTVEELQRNKIQAVKQGLAPMSILSPTPLGNSSFGDSATKYGYETVMGVRLYNLAQNETKDVSLETFNKLLGMGAIQNDSFRPSSLATKSSPDEIRSFILEVSIMYPAICEKVLKDRERRFILGKYNGWQVCYNPSNKQLFLRSLEEIKANPRNEKTPFMILSGIEVPDNELPVSVRNDFKQKGSYIKEKEKEKATPLYMLEEDTTPKFDFSKSLKAPESTATKPMVVRRKYETIKGLLEKNADKLRELDSKIAKNIKEEALFEQTTSLRRVLKRVPVTIMAGQIYSENITAPGFNGTTAALTVEQTMIYSAKMLEVVDPYLAVAYNEMKKIPMTQEEAIKENCLTMGVTINEFYYNIGYVATLTLAQLNFVIMHEMYHVIMKHTSRGRKKDRWIWNIAIDLYVNGWLVKNYELKPDMSETGFVAQRHTNNGVKTMTVNFAPWAGALYHPDIDVSSTTPEIIYEELIKEMKNQKKQVQQNGSSSSSGGGQGQQQGGQQGNQQNPQGQQSNQQGQGGQQGQQQGQGQSGQGQGGQQGQGQGNQQGQDTQQGQGQNGQQSNQPGQGQGQGQNGQGQDDIDNYNSENDTHTVAKKYSVDKDGNVESVTVTYRGREFTINKDDLDVYETEETVTKSDEEMMNQGDRKAVEIHESAKDFSAMSNGSALMRLMADVEPIKDISWERFVSKYMNAMSREIKTYRNPNRKMLSHGIIMKGPREAAADSLKGVYICVDTSASISDRELGIVFGYLVGTMRKYHLEGKIVYWDTAVRAVGEFKDTKEMLRARSLASGGGGTNPSCVFDYFASVDCHPKPKLVIFMTDGYFGDFSNPAGRKYGEILWLICSGKEDYKVFKPPFGKKAPLHLYD